MNENKEELQKADAILQGLGYNANEQWYSSMQGIMWKKDESKGGVFYTFKLSLWSKRDNIWRIRVFTYTSISEIIEIEMDKSAQDNIDMHIMMKRL